MVVRGFVSFAWIVVLVGFSACMDLPPNDDDDDEGQAPADDDDGDPAVGGLPEGVTISPEPGTPLPWNGCLELALDDPLPDLTATAEDADGNSWVLFAGTLDGVGVILPTRAWPAGQTVLLELTWDGGSGVVQFPIEDPDPTLLSPVGLGVRASMGGEVCPQDSGIEQILAAMALVLPSYDALVEVLSHDPLNGASQVRYAWSESAGGGQHPSQATHDLWATYDDPLLTATLVPAQFPWTGFSETLVHGWGGLQLAEGGGPPVRNAIGLMAELQTLEDYNGLVGICDDLAYHGAPWCGPCPHDHGETCVYAYVRDLPLEELDFPLEHVDGPVIW